MISSHKLSNFYHIASDCRVVFSRECHRLKVVTVSQEVLHHTLMIPEFEFTTSDCIIPIFWLDLRNQIIHTTKRPDLEILTIGSVASSMTVFLLTVFHVDMIILYQEYV
jgi:hypothetical protein